VINWHLCTRERCSEWKAKCASFEFLKLATLIWMWPGPRNQWNKEHKFGLIKNCGGWGRGQRATELDYLLPMSTYLHQDNNLKWWLATSTTSKERNTLCCCVEELQSVWRCQLVAKKLACSVPSFDREFQLSICWGLEKGIINPHLLLGYQVSTCMIKRFEVFQHTGRELRTVLAWCQSGSLVPFLSPPSSSGIIIGMLKPFLCAQPKDHIVGQVHFLLILSVLSFLFCYTSV
jgi:hypothetical protein